MKIIVSKVLCLLIPVKRKGWAVHRDGTVHALDLGGEGKEMTAHSYHGDRV